MIWPLLQWAGIIAMLWLIWKGIAFTRAGLSGKGNISLIVGVWSIIAAIGAFFMWRMGSFGSFTLMGIVGLALVVLDPIFWALGNVSNRLKAEGVRVNDILRFK